MTITEKIKAIREAKRFTQLEVADALEMERANYARIENKANGNNISYEFLEKVAKVFDMSVTEIVEYGEAKREKVDDEKVKDLETQIELLKRKLNLVTKELEQERGFKKKYSSKFIRITDKNIDLFIPKGDFYFEGSEGYLFQVAFGVLWYNFTDEAINENKEIWLLEVFTYFLLKKCHSFFEKIKIDPKTKKEKKVILYTQFSLEKRKEIYEYLYTTYVHEYLEAFKEEWLIDTLLQIGLLDTTDLVEKWKYAIPKEHFFVFVNEALAHKYCKPEEVEQYRFYNMKKFEKKFEQD